MTTKSIECNAGEGDLTVGIICQILDEYLLASPTGFGVPSLQSFKRLMNTKLNIEWNTSKDGNHGIDFHYSVVDSVNAEDCDNQKQLLTAT